MKLHLNAVQGLNIIKSYNSGVLKIGDDHYTTSVIVTPDEVLQDWSISQIEQLDETLIARLALPNTEVVLLGTGEKIVFPDARILSVLSSKSMGIEVMDTAAACRTYNVLASEGRKVIAGLIIPLPEV